MRRPNLTFLLLATGLTALNSAFWRKPTRSLLRALRAPRRSAEPTAPRVSVVMAARNEEGKLPRALDGLLAQTLPTLEVVVVDDDSDDGTAALLAQRAAGEPRLRPIAGGPKGSPGKKATLATAIAHAAHDWLLATDADCVPASPQWAATMHSAAGPHDEIVLGYSPYRPSPTPTWLNRWVRFEAFYTAVQYLSAASAGRPYMGVGRNLLYARRLYERVGGFAAHAHLAGGDDDLLVAAGARGGNVAVCVDERAWTYTDPHEEWRAYARQKRRHLSVARAYRPLDQMWLGLLAASHLGHYLGLALLLARGEHRAAALLYGGRLAVIWPRAAALQRRMGLADLVALFPLADAALAGYYLLGAVSVGADRGRSDAW